MIVNEYYEIEIIANKTLLDIQPAGFTFSITDSIHETYPTLTLLLNDVAGILQEYLLTVEGLIYEITYGTTEESISSKFVVLEDSLTEPLSQGIMNGQVKMKMAHEYYASQELLSKAYENRISLIVRELSNKYLFKGSEINDTGNQDIWYQMLMSDEQFMREVLLPNAYSNNSFDTPFFLFIGSDNVFHFQHYKAMIDRAAEVDLVYVPQTEETSKDPNVIRSIRRVHVGAPTTKPLRSRYVFSHNQDTGELLEEEDSFIKYPSNSTVLPLIADSSLKTGYTDLGFEETKPGRQEALKGREISSMIDGLFLDRFLIEVPLNIGLRSGRTVNLNIRSYKTEEGDQNSLAYRGKYLIERSTHTWDGKSQNGRTQLLVSRKNIDVPTTYYIGNQLFRG